jgi:hypothetical protein
MANSGAEAMRPTDRWGSIWRSSKAAREGRCPKLRCRLRRIEVPTVEEFARGVVT